MTPCLNVSFLLAHRIDTKKEMKDEKKLKVINQLLDQTEEQQAKSLFRSIDKIMIAHRNTKLFMLLMSGPFLFFILLLKYSAKVLILYLIYK